MQVMLFVSRVKFQKRVVILMNKTIAYKCFSGEAGVGDICTVFMSSSLSLQYSLEDPTDVLPPQPIV